MGSEIKPVAITGASGFIGNHLVQTLLHQDTSVRAFARDPRRLQINDSRLEIIQGDLHSPATLEQLIHGADYVIHCAGRVRGACEEDFYRDNVLGTKNLLRACERKRTVKRLIHISSLAAREPDISYYSKSKHLAENLIKNINFAEWTILRPPAVYGPNDKELLPLFDWMQKGILWIPGNPKQKFSLIHVQDLVDLTALQITSDTCGEILEPDDSESYNWDLVAQLCSEFFGRKIQKIVVPNPALSAAAKLNVLLSRLINSSPMLTPSKLSELQHNNWLASGIDPSHGWSAHIDLKKGLSTLYS